MSPSVRPPLSLPNVYLGSLLSLGTYSGTGRLG